MPPASPSIMKEDISGHHIEKKMIMFSAPVAQLVETWILGAYHPKILGSIASGYSGLSSGSWR